MTNHATWTEASKYVHCPVPITNGIQDSTKITESVIKKCMYKIMMRKKNIIEHGTQRNSNWLTTILRMQCQVFASNQNN